MNQEKHLKENSESQSSARARPLRFCVICRAPAGRRAAIDLCRACDRSYDRMNAGDGDTASLIEWVARRCWVAASKMLRTEVGRRHSMEIDHFTGRDMNRPYEKDRAT